MSTSRYAALIAALVLAIFAAFLAGAEPAGAASSPQMRFDKYMAVQSVCFTVTNPSLGQSTLFGQRFTDGTVSPQTPAIVLVHGIASSTENWDFSPTWSVARALAGKGYVVYSYDRLGYAKSSYYDHPGGGYTLTTSAHRDELHDIVTEVKSGAYTTTTGSDCSGAQQPSTIHNDRVVIIGHSAGGWIVAGYPGKYHDVAAMIQTDISGSISPPNAPLGSSTGGGFTTSPDHPDYFQFFQTSQNCRDFNTYTPGIVPYVVDIACAPPFLLSPWGEIADLGEKYAENDFYISQIGPSIPVLLTSGDHDSTDPPSVAKADYDYYQANCGCDVTQWIVPNTAHLFMVHTSLPSWIDYVSKWLTSRGIAPVKTK
jgi:pimeloyl-ACP methyl ester carboxylesterase